MPGIPSRPDLPFDLFDALGLNPTADSITVASIHSAWRRVNLHIHPDKLATARYIPSFPTYAQARSAKDYLLAEEKGASNPESRIQAALASGRKGYRSTWNPWATPNTEEVLKPMPGALNTWATPNTEDVPEPMQWAPSAEVEVDKMGVRDLGRSGGSLGACVPGSPTTHVKVQEAVNEDWTVALC
ncbi:hypothetical protein MMC18_004168 [Xylographa bjoerkii]|nr:hypothetical protein [Xylographa bjoerkii]